MTSLCLKLLRSNLSRQLLVFLSLGLVSFYSVSAKASCEAEGSNLQQLVQYQNNMRAEYNYWNIRYTILLAQGFPRNYLLEQQMQQNYLIQPAQLVVEASNVYYSCLPAVSIVSAPQSTNFSEQAVTSTFVFSARAGNFAGASQPTLMCALNNGVYLACGNSISYTTFGTHTLNVYPVDANGTAGPAVSYRWTVQAPPSGGCGTRSCHSSE